MIRAILVILLCTAAANAEDRAREIPLATVQAVLEAPANSEPVKALSKAIGAEPIVAEHAWGLFYNWKEAGLSLRIDKGRVSAVFISVNSSTGEQRYRGELPGGLSLSDTRETVERKLGAPTFFLRENGREPVAAVYPERGVNVVYVWADPKDRANKIRNFMITPRLMSQMRTAQFMKETAATKPATQPGE